MSNGRVVSPTKSVIGHTLNLFFALEGEISLSNGNGKKGQGGRRFLSPACRGLIHRWTEKLEVPGGLERCAPSLLKTGQPRRPPLFIIII